ncbi:MAG: hypothetical protein ACREJG_09345 [Candidatus Rokuibacteriota bacterium]
MLACAALLASVQPAAGVTGREWIRLPPPARAAYVAAIVDAWNNLAAVQESLGVRDRAVTGFTDVVGCVRERLMAPPQILAVVERYAQDHPGLLGKDMPDVVFAALTDACRR